MNSMKKRYEIENCDLKSLSGDLMDIRISHHIYVGGLRMIVIEEPLVFKNYEELKETLDKYQEATVTVKVLQNKQWVKVNA
jgi:hypothetical protein